MYSKHQCSDGDFLAWSTAFLAYAATHTAELGLAPTDLTDGTAAPPTDLRQYTFLTLATASLYTAEFDSAHAGQTAHYLLRWVTTRGEKGPWSETVAATIAR